MRGCQPARWQHLLGSAKSRGCEEKANNLPAKTCSPCPPFQETRVPRRVIALGIAKMSLVYANIAAYAPPRAHAGRRTSTTSSRTRSPAPKCDVALRKARGTVVPRAVVDPAAVVPALNSQPDEFAVLEATPNDTYVDVVFKDGASFRFHALWLRDACSDPNHVVADAGERILSMLPVNTGCDADLRAASCEIDETGGLIVTWTNHEIQSTFGAKSLRAFADVVAKPLVGSEIPPLAASETEWLDPFTGYPDAPGQSPSQIDYYKNEDGVVFPSYDHDAVVRDPKLKLDVGPDLGGQLLEAGFGCLAQHIQHSLHGDQCQRVEVSAL